MHVPRQRILIALGLIGALAAAAAPAIGQEDEGLGTDQGMEETAPTTSAAEDPQTAAVAILDAILTTVNETTVESLPDDQVAVTAQQIVNALEGTNGAHYDASVAIALADDAYGAIPYLEELTGTDAISLADPEAVVTAGTESPAVIALAHLVLADGLLSGEAVDRTALLEAVTHLGEAKEALS